MVRGPRRPAEEGERAIVPIPVSAKKRDPAPLPVTNLLLLIPFDFLWRKLMGINPPERGFFLLGKSIN
jgi:hypothetical protein